MNNDFVRRFAPKLFVPSADAPRAGLAEENHPYDETGTPLPYFQEQGGPRQYFGTPGPDGLRGRMPDAGLMAPTPSTPSAQTVPTAPFSPVMPPQDMLRGRGTRNGPRAVVPIPPDPRIVDSENRQREEIRRWSGEDGLDPVRPRNLQNPEGMTLQDMLSQFNFNLPTFSRPQTNDGLRGRQSDGDSSITPLPEVDARLDYAPGRRRRPTVNVRDVSQGFLPDFSTEEGLADFNRRTGLELGSQIRTQAQQDRLYNRGLTPTRRSAHIGGRAVDIPSRNLNGFSYAAAEEHVRGMFEDAGYDTSQLTFTYETGRGRNQGTGPHVHVEPR